MRTGLPYDLTNRPGFHDLGRVTRDLINITGCCLTNRLLLDLDRFAPFAP